MIQVPVSKKALHYPFINKAALPHKRRRQNYDSLDNYSKSIISSFLTLQHSLDCLVSTRNAMSIVLLLQIMRGWDRWGAGVVPLHQCVGGGTGTGYHLIVFVFFLCLCILLSQALSPFI